MGCFWPEWALSRLEGTCGYAKSCFLTRNMFLTRIDTGQAIEARGHTKVFSDYKYIRFWPRWTSSRKSVFYNEKCVFWPVTLLEGSRQFQVRESGTSEQKEATGSPMAKGNHWVGLILVPLFRGLSSEWIIPLCIRASPSSGELKTKDGAPQCPTRFHDFRRPPL